MSWLIANRSQKTIRTSLIKRRSAGIPDSNRRQSIVAVGLGFDLAICEKERSVSACNNGYTRRRRARPVCSPSVGRMRREIASTCRYQRPGRRRSVAGNALMCAARRESRQPGKSTRQVSGVLTTGKCFWCIVEELQSLADSVGWDGGSLRSPPLDSERLGSTRGGQVQRGRTWWIGNDERRGKSCRRVVWILPGGV